MVILNDETIKQRKVLHNTQTYALLVLSGENSPYIYGSSYGFETHTVQEKVFGLNLNATTDQCKAVEDVLR